MALSQSEKLKIIKFIGWSYNYLRVGDTKYSTTINEKLTNIDDETETQLRTYIERIDEIDAILRKATARLAVTNIDRISLNQYEMGQLRTERRNVIREMQYLIDLPTPTEAGVY